MALFKLKLGGHHTKICIVLIRSAFPWENDPNLDSWIPPKDYSFFTYHSEGIHIKSYLMWILAFTIHAWMKWIEKCAPCKHWQEAQSFRQKCEAHCISAWFCCNKSNWLRPLSWFLPVKDQVNKWLFKSQHLKFLLMYAKQ